MSMFITFTWRRTERSSRGGTIENEQGQAPATRFHRDRFLPSLRWCSWGKVIQPRAATAGQRKRPALPVGTRHCAIYDARLTRLTPSRERVHRRPWMRNKVLNWKFPEIEHAYTEKDTILYALGLGCGSDGPHSDDFKFVYEEGLVALPMMAVVLASPGNWLGSKESTVDYTKVLHGEQYLTLHRPLPPAGKVVGRGRIVDLLDKGKDKGAVLYAERTIIDKASGDDDRHADLGRHAARRWRLRRQARPAARAAQASRGRPQDPRRHQDLSQLGADLSALRRQEPAARRPQGRRRRRLQDADPARAVHLRRGGRAIVKACCGGDPARLKSLQVRFSAPVFPGETIRTEMWPDGEPRLVPRPRGGARRGGAQQRAGDGGALQGPGSVRCMTGRGCSATATSGLIETVSHSLPPHCPRRWLVRAVQKWKQRRAARKVERSAWRSGGDPQLNGELAAAVAHLQASRLPEAAAAHRRILAIDPRHAASLHHPAYRAQGGQQGTGSGTHPPMLGDQAGLPGCAGQSYRLPASSVASRRQLRPATKQST